MTKDKTGKSMVFLFVIIAVIAFLLSIKVSYANDKTEIRRELIKLRTIERELREEIKNKLRPSKSTLKVKQLDHDRIKMMPQGNGSLEGAEFLFSYYPNTDGNVDEAVYSTWTFRTDKNGDAVFDKKHFVEGDELPKNRKGKTTPYYGTYIIEQIKAPDGYTEAEKSLEVIIKEGKKKDSVRSNSISCRS